MKLFFYHDHKFISKLDDSKTYTSGSFPSIVWDRYLTTFSNVVITSRVEMQFDKLSDKHALASHTAVTFNFIPRIRSFYHIYSGLATIRQSVKQAIKSKSANLIRLPSFIGLAAGLLLYITKNPYYCEVVGNGYDSLSNHSNPIARLISNPFHALTKFLVLRSAATIYVTQHYLQSIYPCLNHSTFASNVELKEYFSNATIKPDTKTHRNQNLIWIFGFMANVDVKYKGINVLIVALSRLSLENPNLKWELHIAGAGNYDAVQALAIKHNISKRIKYIGLLKHGISVSNYFDSIDIFFNPSAQEGLPRSVIEAMSRGCIIIASKIAGTPELLDDRFLHHPYDSRSLTKIIDFVVNLRDNRFVRIQNKAVSEDYNSSNLEMKRLLFMQAVKSRQIISNK